jgi:hypothetical protein
MILVDEKNNIVDPTENEEYEDVEAFNKIKIPISKKGTDPRRFRSLFHSLLSFYFF